MSFRAPAKNLTMDTSAPVLLSAAPSELIRICILTQGFAALHPVLLPYGALPLQYHVVSAHYNFQLILSESQITWITGLHGSRNMTGAGLPACGLACAQQAGCPVSISNQKSAHSVARSPERNTEVQKPSTVNLRRPPAEAGQARHGGRGFLLFRTRRHRVIQRAQPEESPHNYFWFLLPVLLCNSPQETLRSISFRSE